MRKEQNYQRWNWILHTVVLFFRCLAFSFTAIKLKKHSEDLFQTTLNDFYL